MPSSAHQQTALMWASFNGNAKVVQELVDDFGANVNATNKVGWVKVVLVGDGLVSLSIIPCLVLLVASLHIMV